MSKNTPIINVSNDDNNIIIDMARTEKRDNDTWTTWEELLLACAVKRHGFQNWDSVAMEIQTRSSLPHLLTTAQNCQQKYHDLKRRFTATAKDNDAETQSQNQVRDETDTIPWLEELRKLRVAELRNEVHRSDVSILSLQLKVKRLEEEREQSTKENDNDVVKPDLDDEVKEERSKDEVKEGDEVPEKSSPEGDAGKLISGEESDRENRSVNESNSTGVKGENIETAVEEAAREPEPTEPGSTKPDPVSSDSKPVGEDSYNGSSEPNRAKKADDSSELRESAAHSKDGTKESSDVQSSASLTRKRKRRRKKEISGSSSGDEPETEAVSPATKRICVKSQPLVSFLEIIRSHKHSSLFERRLETQETEVYKSIVRQHVDLESIQTKLDDGTYSSSPRAFYRDLLLLFTNAIVFFPKASAEALAAGELRAMVLNEVRKQQPPAPEHLLLPQPKPELERSDSLLAKQKSSAPIIVCRKRSSISAKASSFGVKAGESRSEEKPAVDIKPSVREEQSLVKAGTKEKSTTGVRSLRRGGKNRSGNLNKNQSTSTNHGSSDKGETPKAEKKKADASASAKKRGAADFLKRIKKNSPMDMGKSTVNDTRSGRGGGGGEEKRKRNEKGDGRRDRVLRQSGGGKQGKDESSPSKRSVGRPPKKAAADTGKRGRESGGEKEAAPAASSSKRARKQARR
ncbi:uncharacterized protein LOC100263099 [Vitis vinifera]|uniref:Uncharacterized protein n=2 Tax=Vitis vinifera TaxID=29760 RepID=A5AP96_VITVI|nr:uncharacterized protein LOC100263099 [Vitis vinifera]RVW93587.1 hypothetical protein CK203_028875 [Vitis vinifera]CAN75881.1 hypothetical protein VITISV_024454 [Vitis vinifera]|eukprot:XP_002268328.1 PREDICTED: uncharacterized protein LOC100263099 [Vitis vinifera]